MAVVGIDDRGPPAQRSPHGHTTPTSPFRIPPPPEFRSREAAAEISENYWMALLRDVPFSQYPRNQIAIDAAADLTRYGADAKVPKNSSGQVTPALLFRGLTQGTRS